MRVDWSKIRWPEPTCMNCGEKCDTTQELVQPYDPEPVLLWCYCEACDIETFHLPCEEVFLGHLRPLH